MKLLRIDSSARGTSVTRKLTSVFAAMWKKENPGGEVVGRDLSTMPLPHITDDWAATYSGAEMTEAQRQYLAVSDQLISELSAADVIVLGAPMYNLMISWELKAWIDQVVRAGKTMIYGPTGPKGLLEGKKVVVITSRGGSYSTDVTAPNFDFQEAYLRRILGLMGLNHITFIHADNQRRGGEHAEASLAAAMTRVEQAASGAKLAA